MTIYLGCDNGECEQLIQASLATGWLTWAEKESEVHFCSIKCFREFLEGLEDQVSESPEEKEN